MTDPVTKSTDLDDVKRRWAALSIDEQIAVLRRAEARGVSLPPLMIPILEAAAHPSESDALRITDETTDEEVLWFLHGEKRPETRTRYSLLRFRRKPKPFQPLKEVLWRRQRDAIKRWHQSFTIMRWRRTAVRPNHV